MHSTVFSWKSFDWNYEPFGFYSQINLSCRANCAATGTALSALRALENYSHQSKLEHNGGREENSGEIISRGSFASKEWRWEMLATNQRYNGGQGWIPWSWYWDILQHPTIPAPPSHPQTSIPSSPWRSALTFNCSFLLPSCQSFVSPNAHPCRPIHSRVTLIFLQSISISSCEWSSPINSAVGGEKGKAKAIRLFNYCVLFMCQGTYIYGFCCMPPYVDVWREKKKPRWGYGIWKQEPQQWRNKVPIMCGNST